MLLLKKMYIDTHAHLDFPDFDNDRDEVIRRAQSEGIGCIINVSSSLKGCRQSLDLAHRYDNVYASLGIHPHNAQEAGSEGFDTIKALANAKKVVAIGEVGLDFYPAPARRGGVNRNLSADSAAQKEVFIKFIELGISLRLPLIIHSRQAEIETIEVLRKYASATLNGVVHCFSGDKDFLNRCLDLGLHISFTCNITYKKSEVLRELVKLVPMDRLLLETDCPYLSPEGMRGKRNEPFNVKSLAQKIAELKNCNVEEVAAKTTENAKRLFKI